MKPEDFKNKEPRLIIEEYLSGNVKAWGVLQNRSGKVTRQFSADLNGKWDGKQLILDEKFNWDDGEIQTRQWQITKIDENNYEGTAGDVVGKAKGYSYGPAFKFEYVLLVPVKGKEMKITFDDWIFKQDDRVAINRATMTKFGFKSRAYSCIRKRLIFFYYFLANDNHSQKKFDNDNHSPQFNCF